MAVEVIVKDAALREAVRELYVSAQESGLRDEELAIFAQVFVHDIISQFVHDVVSPGTRIRMVTVSGTWMDQIKDVLDRMKASKTRAAKRKAKPKKPARKARKKGAK